MTPDTPAVTLELFPEVSWGEVFEEGERRIKERFLDAMLQVPTRDRARLLAQRDAVQKRITSALIDGDGKKLTRALNEQIRLLAKIHATFPAQA